MAVLAILHFALVFWSACAAAPLSLSEASCPRRSKCIVEPWDQRKNPPLQPFGRCTRLAASYSQIHGTSGRRSTSSVSDSKRSPPPRLALLFRAAKLTAAFRVTKCSLTFARLRRLPHYRLMQISKPATLMNRKRSQEMSNFVSKPALLACPSKTVLDAAIARYTGRI